MRKGHVDRANHCRISTPRAETSESRFCSMKEVAATELRGMHELHPNLAHGTGGKAVGFGRVDAVAMVKATAAQAPSIHRNVQPSWLSYPPMML
jgi:hypothetical protein